MNSIIVSDFIEITLLTLFFYYCFIWLDRNKKKSFLKPILMIITLNAFAWIFDLKALQVLFFYITTPGSIIYYLTHQKELKKDSINTNYRGVSKNNASYECINQIQKNITVIIQEGIHALYEEKNIVYILERSDSLDNLIVPSLFFNTIFSREIIKFFIQSTEQEKICSILIKNNIIVGPMITLFDQLTIGYTQQEIQELFEPILADTDAIILLGFYKTNLWTILHQGHGCSDLTTKELFAILHQFLYTEDHSHYDAIQNNKNTASQHSL